MKIMFVDDGTKMKGKGKSAEVAAKATEYEDGADVAPDE